MSILSSITDTTPIAVQRSTRLLARGIVRVVNNFVAAIIAQREHQANLTILRTLSDRELRDMGLTRGQIGVGLAEAAKERAQARSNSPLTRQHGGATSHNAPAGVS